MRAVIVSVGGAIGNGAASLAAGASTFLHAAPWKSCGRAAASYPTDA